MDEAAWGQYELRVEVSGGGCTPTASTGCQLPRPRMELLTGCAYIYSLPAGSFGGRRPLSRLAGRVA